MRIPRFPLLAASLLAQLTFAAAPRWTVLNTGLNDTFGNSGKGVLDPQTTGLVGVAYGNNIWVATATSIDETVVRWATSTDAISWTAHSRTIDNGGKAAGVTKVHFLNGKFVFFATHSIGGSAVGYVYTSTDGLTWTATKVANGTHNFVDFDASATATVAAGSNMDQWRSTDLATWTASQVVTSGTYSHNDIAYGAGHFVSTINGFGGQAYTSTDGATWTAISGLAAPGGVYVEYGNGVFLSGTGNSWFRSTDGVTFTTFTPTGPSILRPPSTNMRFAGGRFVCQQYDFSSNKNGFLASSDGQTWTDFGVYDSAPAVPAGQSRSYILYDLAFGNGKYVAVGQDIAQTLLTKTVLPVIIVADAPVAPSPAVISAQPQSTNAVLGGSASFSVTATGGGLTYQWKHGSSTIAGATSATLSLSNIGAADAGSYTVVITNDAGAVTSNTATLTIVTASNAGHLINMSIRSNAGSGDATLIVGASLGGANTSGTTSVLVRGVGPTLKVFGVGAALDDPAIKIYQGTSVLAENDDWAGGFNFSSVGAFGFSGTPVKDAAYYASAVTGGTYSVQITGKNNGTGIALAELYDTTPSDQYAASRPRLINVSARTAVGTGENLLITGFAIGGSTAVKVLIRAVGPTLSAFNVGGVLANPKLQVFNSASAKIAENDDWSGTAELKAAFQAVSAFGLASDTSKDAALIVTLQPGTYSAQVSGVNDTTGIALVEVYELP